MKNELRQLFSIPSVSSIFVMTVFSVICLGFMHPGYAINDDLKIISVLSGFPVGNPTPFLIYSNILLGFILTPLYALHTALNWEILIFSLINLLSLWGLMYILFASPMQILNKAIGASIILGGAAYFVLNITYTSVALLACFAGICLIWSSSKSSSPPKKAPIVSGVILVLLGSLIRVEMLVLILPVTLSGLIFIAPSLGLKSFFLGCLLAGSLVGAGYVFDRLYVRSNPAWHTYYFYNKARQSLHDSHRLENIHSEIRHVGWSGNDQELFARWFFPDQGTYSLDHIKYLDAHVPATSGQPLMTLTNFVINLGHPQFATYLILMAGTLLWFLYQLPSRKPALILLIIGTFCLGENLFLAWAYKDPEYVLMSSLACGTILGVVIMPYIGAGGSNQLSSFRHRTILSTITFYGSWIFLAAGMVSILNLSIATSTINLNKQIAYQRILADLNNLKQEGKISANPLIISPAHGLPMEWSNPFILQFPGVPYFDTGWITFSPSYEQTLQKFGIQSLVDALYQKDNIYLMTRSNFTVFLARYYLEHENITVAFRPIYTMPNTFNFAGYDDIKLYKVVK